MTEIDARILVVDDDEDVLQAARIFLKQHLKEVHTETDPSRIPDLLTARDYSLILLDMNFSDDVSSGREGFHWLEQILQVDPSAVVILITAYGDVEMAVRAIKEGATDFVLKPWQNEKLLATISAGLDLKRLRTQVASLKTREKMLSDDIDRKFSDFIASSSVMQEVFTTIEKIAGTDANVLILGENGTGKELVAREIHRQSKRANEVFISVDMGAITETLFESELFGHKKGAFTDAREDRSGRFEIASGGTLFLDEIGNLPLPLQAKLLSVLQNRQVTRIGSNASIPIDIRLVCATNLPIHSMVAEDRFRQDLLYRINTVEIRIPPLRQRGEDIHLLVEHFLEIFCKKYGKSRSRVLVSALKRLEKYDWPGNVRELQHAVERAVIMSDSNTLGPGDFFLASRETRGKNHAFDSSNLEEVEREVIRNAMIKHDGNVSHAAKELGLTRTSLYRRMRKHDL
ncbi:MAG: sigma-54 dependent transcriptional regulator [candidate division Zixibacteria bacterium]|nr:sigma-54 dependent transcriptional regulator [candidate division Zixibacteria bacterium]MBU1470139.1 sigma-54 dependent transcriptional regulator [candidate division Zixibacteria bacterium]MBU2626018.1 sigma-54 dependent transcriptional regulator [candidate division Zixibacteria bacterium]